jgi:hypothetical protein
VRPGIGPCSRPCPALVFGASEERSTTGLCRGGRTRSSAAAEPGTTRSRSLAHGPRMPWYRTRWKRGGGTRAPDALRTVHGRGRSRAPAGPLRTGRSPRGGGVRRPAHSGDGNAHGKRRVQGSPPRRRIASSVPAHGDGQLAREGASQQSRGRVFTLELTACVHMPWPCPRPSSQAMVKPRRARRRGLLPVSVRGKVIQ